MHISPALIVQHRPLTRTALDNKIRAIISQLHPRQRRLASIAYENSTKYSCSMLIQTPIVITDEYISTENKVSQWLKNLDHHSQRKLFNDAIVENVDQGNFL